MTHKCFQKIQRFFQFFYLFTVLSLLLVYYLATSNDFLINKVVFTIILIFTGFKFEFLHINTKYLKLFTKRFKYDWLNCINFVVQFFVFIGLLTDRYPVYLFKYIGLTNQNNVLTGQGLFIAVFISTLMLLSFVFTVTLPKLRDMFQSLVAAIGIMVTYLISFSLFNVIVESLFGKIPNNLDFSLLAVLFVTISMAYTMLHNFQFNMPVLFKLTNKKYFLTFFPFLVLIFCIDSAIWLHPISTWNFPNISMLIFSFRSGLGEEFIYRILIMSIFIAVLNKYEYGPIYAIFMQSILFGLFHLVNIISGDPVSATVASTIDAFGIGTVFGVLYLLTKNIGVIVIIHCLWDLLQSIVTGSGNMSVSGAEGFVITTCVMVVCIIYSAYLISRNLIFFKSKSVKHL